MHSKTHTLIAVFVFSLAGTCWLLAQHQDVGPHDEHSVVKQQDDPNMRGRKRELAGRVAVALCMGQAASHYNTHDAEHMSARDTALYAHDVVEILYDLYPE